MDISDIPPLLRAHAEEHRLEQRAHEGFKAYVDECIAEKDELPHGWKYDELTAELGYMCLWFRPPLLNHPYIDTKLVIKRHGATVGYFRLITTMTGEEEDDYFVIHES